MWHANGRTDRTGAELRAAQSNADFDLDFVLMSGHFQTWATEKERIPSANRQRKERRSIFVAQVAVHLPACTRTVNWGTQTALCARVG
jgi:endogenous inhibitor of DNA gyrase (YacG/DUF329 family)